MCCSVQFPFSVVIAVINKALNRQYAVIRMEFDTDNYVSVCFSISPKRFFIIFSIRHPKVSFDFKRFSLRRIIFQFAAVDNLWRQATTRTHNNSFWFFFSLLLLFAFLFPKTELDHVNSRGPWQCDRLKHGYHINPSSLVRRKNLNNS